MCSDVSFYLQFITFMIMLACVPVACLCVKLSEDMAKPAKRLRRGRR
jgi:hypothetical protein